VLNKYIIFRISSRVFINIYPDLLRLPGSDVAADDDGNDDDDDDDNDNDNNNDNDSDDDDDDNDNDNDNDNDSDDDDDDKDDDDLVNGGRAVNNTRSYLSI
jgi:hypothetical protein